MNKETSLQGQASEALVAVIEDDWNQAREHLNLLSIADLEELESALEDLGHLCASVFQKKRRKASSQ